MISTLCDGLTVALGSSTSVLEIVMADFAFSVDVCPSAMSHALTVVVVDFMVLTVLSSCSAIMR